MRPRTRRISALLQTGAIFVTLGLVTGRGTGAAETSEPAGAMHSLAGSYLAGRMAREENDTGEAAAFFANALAWDPGSQLLREQAFLMEALGGSGPDTIRRAEELIEVDPQHRTARLFLALNAFKEGDLKVSEQQFNAASGGPIGELTSSIALAWLKLSEKDVSGALDKLEVPKQAEWAQFYLRYHRALIADLGGRKQEARASFERVFRQDPRALRTALAYARHAAHNGDRKLARSILKEHIEKSQGEVHALVRSLDQEIASGRPVDLLITSPAEGLAEVFYGLGEALVGEGAIETGIHYMQMALSVAPSHPFALAALANALEGTKRYTDAIEVYDRIPKGSALDLKIEIRKALNLNSLEKVDEARKTLTDLLDRMGPAAAPEPTATTDGTPDENTTASDGTLLLALGSKGERVRQLQEALKRMGLLSGDVDGQFGDTTRRAVMSFQRNQKGMEVDGMAGVETWSAIVGAAPSTESATGETPATAEKVIVPSLNDQLDVLDALGSILRSHKLYAESVDVYTKALALIRKPDRHHWVYFYARGTSYERMKNWPASEADLQKALELAPDQPLVLNYLGYSWIDQGLNLKQGMSLIEKAVALKPDDGYIVDSLGWAHYKLGNYKQAVRYLERAVELRPDDPILNDHLGDAMWRVGREREARFQWDQALSLNPEPEDLEKIKHKITEGLGPPDPVVPERKTTEAQQADPAGKAR